MEQGERDPKQAPHPSRPHLKLFLKLLERQEQRLVRQHSVTVAAIISSPKGQSTVLVRKRLQQDS